MDSTIWKLKVSEQKWTKCDDCELTKRAGHAMHVHNEKVSIVGGYKYEDNLAKQIFSLTQVVELTVHVTGSILPTFVNIIELVEFPLNMTVGNIYGFGSVATDSHIYLFGGFIVIIYDDTKETLYESHSPYQSRGELLPLSSALFHIDIEEKIIEKNYAHQEYATVCPTMHITDINNDGKA